MLEVEAQNKSVTRVELDQRARDARLGLERVQRLLVPRAAATASWFRWVVCLFTFGRLGDASRAGQIRGLLSDRRPPTPQIPSGWAAAAG
jgi:hypothetical protein